MGGILTFKVSSRLATRHFGPIHQIPPRDGGGVQLVRDAIQEVRVVAVAIVRVGTARVAGLLPRNRSPVVGRRERVGDGLGDAGERVDNAHEMEVERTGVGPGITTLAVNVGAEPDLAAIGKQQIAVVDVEGGALESFRYPGR